VGGGDMLGNVGEHIFTALDIFVEKVRRKLRVKNTRGADGEKDEKQNRNESDEEAGNDEAVAQAPEQAAASEGQQAVEQVKGGEQGDKFEVIKNAAIHFKEVSEASGQCQDGGDKIQAGNAVP
jgi:hypothetical protein